MNVIPKILAQEMGMKLSLIYLNIKNKMKFIKIF